MLVPGSSGYALNRSRHAYLATHLRIAATHWSRFCGLMCTGPANFPAGQGLWIVPSRGIHTLAMRFPIDVVYLDRDKVVVLKPWHVAPIRMCAASVLELPSHTLSSTGTVVGDEIEIDLGHAGKADQA